MRACFRVCIVSGSCALALAATAARAAPLFEVQLANPGVSIFRIENLGTASEELTSVGVHIGDTDWNFDIVAGFTNMQDAGAMLMPTLVEGDAQQDQLRVDRLQVDFTGFEVGDRFQFSTDVDEDAGGNTPSDFRTIYWNNGATDNATITLVYTTANQGPGEVTFTFPDDPVDRDVYTFLIPEPSALGILVAIAALGPRRRPGTYSPHLSRAVHTARALASVLITLTSAGIAVLPWRSAVDFRR